MPRKFRDITLPEVTIKGDAADLVKLIQTEDLPPETLVELALFSVRERTRISDALDELEAAARAKLSAYYDGLSKDARGTVRAGAGMATYTPPGEKVEVRDRDKLVEELSPEQLRVSYKPDLKALKTILKPAMFKRVTKTTPTDPKIGIRDTGGDFEYLTEAE